MPTQWMYLTDLAPSATIKNLTTGETRSIMSNAVVDRAPSGLRRTVLEEVPGGMFRETDQVLPLTAELAEEIEEYYHQPNSWNYDWPHLPTEQGDSADAQQALRDLIMAQMGDVPFDFQITAMQRRFLMYFSDGNMESQQRFDRFIPQPQTSPFNRLWQLRPRYDMYYNSIMRDAKVPFPKDKSKWGSGRPCLYVGPAWTLRFRIDDQDPLLERCRVYVMDDGTFIGSDWCQRHDFSSYSNGINLQMGIYSLSSWVMGPCLTYNNQHGGIKLKGSTYKVERVRELVKKTPLVAVPSFDESFNKAQSLIQQYAPKVTTPTKPDAGPITKDVLAQAEAEFQRILKEIAEQRATVPAAERGPVDLTQRMLEDSPDYVATMGDWQLFRVRCEQQGSEKSIIAYRFEESQVACQNLGLDGQCQNLGLDGQVKLLFSPDDSVFQYFMENERRDEDGEVEFWYLGSSAEELSPGDDPLNTHWWLYHAACYYRDVLKETMQVNPVTTTLLETV